MYALPHVRWNNTSNVWHTPHITISTVHRLVFNKNKNRKLASVIVIASRSTNISTINIRSTAESAIYRIGSCVWGEKVFLGKCVSSETGWGRQRGKRQQQHTRNEFHGSFISNNQSFTLFAFCADCFFLWLHASSPHSYIKICKYFHTFRYIFGDKRCDINFMKSHKRNSFQMYASYLFISRVRCHFELFLPEISFVDLGCGCHQWWQFAKIRKNSEVSQKCSSSNPSRENGNLIGFSVKFVEVLKR